MIQIRAYKEDFEKLIHIIQGLFRIDVAIFDLDSRLLACTGEYLLHKGKAVHAPSIDEAIANGNVIVNKPGHMPTCSGCRFIGNCPAKIEILRSIRTDDTPIGVMQFTSFSREGHDRMVKDIRLYVDTLKTFSDWMARLIAQKHVFSRLDRTDQVLESLMDLAGESMLSVDTRGIVDKCNSPARSFFSACDLYTRSLYHILPEQIVDKILDGNRLEKIRLLIDNRPAVLSARPVFAGDRFDGAVLSMRRERQGARPVGIESGPDTDTAGLSLSAILGESPAIRRIKQTVIKIRKSSSTILITGETGTGKGLLARVIHSAGVRADGPFVTVNCTSIPETLFESELFGYEEGAFTGAKKGGKPGRFELAQGGTLFLDEIGEMPLHMQVKLLNVLQDYSFQRVGGTLPIPIDVRIIAATNQDLDRLVDEKRFRADLFYRLNVIPMELPPLIRRRGDIRDLAAAFLKDANQKTGKQVSNISGPVMALLQSHHWPGNIRELQNIIEYSINMEETDTITVKSLPRRFLIHHKVLPAAAPRQVPSPGPVMKSRVMAAEIETIMACLDRNGHDVRGKTLTARELGFSLRTLYRKLKPFPAAADDA